MLKFWTVVALLAQTALIGLSGHLLLTGSTQRPGLHIALIFINVAFGVVNIWNLLRA